MRKWMSWAAAPVLLSGCMMPEPGPLLLVHGGAEVEGTTPAWCYSTLADADCYLERDPAASDRLIGAYLPAEPAAAPNADPQ
jgi:hypothetical protein